MVRACFGRDSSILPSWRRISGNSIEALAEGLAAARDEQRLGHGAAHQPAGAHAVRQPRAVDHVGHLLEAASAFADQIGFGGIEPDLAARH